MNKALSQASKITKRSLFLMDRFLQSSVFWRKLNQAGNWLWYREHAVVLAKTLSSLAVAKTQ